MRRRMLIAMALILVLGLAALISLRHYSLELVNAVVANAVVQKAPEGYSAQTIQEAFAARLRQARESGTKDRYLAQLERISQRLEKIQLLEADEVDQLLNGLKR